MEAPSHPLSDTTVTGPAGGSSADTEPGSPLHFGPWTPRFQISGTPWADTAALLNPPR